MAQTTSQSQIESFKFEAPTALDAPKMHFQMARSKILGLGIQVLKEGGETNLHAHGDQDAVWWVLGGKVRFYDGIESVFGDFGPNEGVAIPRSTPYWFESASNEPLTIIRASSRDKYSRTTRLNFSPPAARQVGMEEHMGEHLDVSQHKSDPMVALKYESPDFGKGPKQVTSIWRSELLSVGIQKIRDGGETNLHAHANQDSAWIVLSGRARWHGKEDGDVWELGVHEGISIPMGVPYWFESASDEPLEIMRVGAADSDVKAERVNYDELKDWHAEHGLGGREATASERAP